MKICAIFILLTFLCPGGCAVYDFDVKTIESPSEFSNDLKLQADLNKEMEQGLMGFGKEMNARLSPQKHFYYNGDKKDYTEFSKNIDASKDSHAHLQFQPSSHIQHYLEDMSDKKEDHIQRTYNKENNEETEDTDNNTDDNVDTDSDSDGDTDTEADDDDEPSEAEMKSQRYAETSLVRAESEINNFVGTNLFDGTRRNCFSSEDIALLTARKDFERLIPKDLPHCLLNDKAVSVLMHYFYGGNQIVQRLGDDFSKRVIEKAFYDTLGGYLKFYVLPVTKYSFYAGELNLKTVSNVVDLYQQCKTFLNTNGNGWKCPDGTILNELKSIHLGPLKVPNGPESGDGASFCARLDLSTVNNEAEDDQMIVSLPKLEPEDSDGCLGNIWLPFKKKRTFNLRSTKSAFIVVKFYEAVTRCYSFQSICQDTYNHKFKSWILENIQVHLSDEQFYPGLGAILKIYENLKRNKKDVTFHNTNDMNENNNLKKDFKDLFQDETEQTQNANDFRDLFFKENQMFDEQNWFTKMFGKRDDKERNDHRKDIDYHDNDDDIDFDDDDLGGDDKDFCPEKPFLLPEKQKSNNKTQNEQRDQGKNTTQENITNAQVPVKTLTQNKIQNKPPDANKEPDTEICKHIQKDKESDSDYEKDPTKEKQKENDKGICKQKEKDDEQTNKDKQDEQKAKDNQIKMDMLKEKVKENEKENEKEKEKEKERDNENENENDTEGGKPVERKRSFITKFLENWACVIVLITMIVLLVLLCCLMGCKRKPKPKPKPKEINKEPKVTKEPEPPLECCQPPKEKKRRRLCDCFSSKTEDDEKELIPERCRNVPNVPICEDEVVVKPESASVIAPPPTRRMSSSTSSSSSAKTCQPPKCIPLCIDPKGRPSPTKGQRIKAGGPSPIRGQRGIAPKETRPKPRDMCILQTVKSDAAIIETTSMDYSSSESDGKTEKIMPQKTKPKAVTIDENRYSRNGPTRNRDKNTDKSQNNDIVRRIGLQRTNIVDPDGKKKLRKSNDNIKQMSEKDKTHSTSWETMYDS